MLLTSPLSRNSVDTRYFRLSSSLMKAPCESTLLPTVWHLPSRRTSAGTSRCAAEADDTEADVKTSAGAGRHSGSGGCGFTFAAEPSNEAGYFCPTAPDAGAVAEAVPATFTGAVASPAALFTSVAKPAFTAGEAACSAGEAACTAGGPEGCFVNGAAALCLSTRSGP